VSQPPRHASPNRARIAQLSDKLTGLQTTLEEERAQKLHLIERRLRGSQDKTDEMADKMHHDTRIVTQQVQRLQSELEEERRAREMLAEAKGEELSKVDQRLQLALQAEIDARKQSHDRVVGFLEEKLRTLAHDVERERSSLDTLEARKIEVTGTLLPELQGLVEIEQTEREKAENRVIQTIQKELRSVEDGLLAEQSSREEGMEVLMKGLQESMTRLKEEVIQERKDREDTQEKLLELLEETCRRIDASQVF
jgi:hypothetical protein